jgi:hypothetical protein
MAAAGVALLTDSGLRQRIGEGGRKVVRGRYCADRIVPLYERFYEEVSSRPTGQMA